MQPLHQRSILRLRVADDDVIIGEQKTVGDLALGAEGFTGTRSTENQAIGVLQQLTVYHDEIVGQSIDAVVQCLFAVLEQFLRGERHKNSRGAGSQSPLDLDLVQTQGQRGHQPLLLLEVQPGQLAVIFLRNGTGLKDVVAQLTGIVCRIQHQEGHKEHSLVAALQVLQKLLGLGSVGSQIAGNDVHIVSCTDGLFLLLDFAPIQICDFSLDGLNGLDLIHRLDMQVHDQTGFHIQKVCQHPVIQLRGENLQKRNSPVFLAHTELLAGAELK